jgi:diguanylate cyclase (GGDEF)-like protein
MSKDKLRILIVDDDREDIILTKGLLRGGLEGVALEVDTADSFAHALRQVGVNNYNLLFLDYQLGEKNGLELIQEIRTKGINTPIVLLTGRGDEQIAVEAMKLGASDYLPKSKLSETLIRTAVRHAIELHEKELQRHRLEQDLRKTNQELARLNQMANALQSCMSLDEAYALVACRAAEFFPNGSGALCMLDGARMTAKVVANWGENPPHKADFTAADCWALRRGRPCVVCDSSPETVCPHFEGSVWSTHVCVPMTASGELFGVLILQGDEQLYGTAEHQGSASEAQSQLAEAFGEQLALSLSNLKLREVLRSQALHDPLTGLFNRRHMEDFLERSTSSAQSHNHPVAVLMLDLDQFKTFNDTQGHLAGDDMLRFLGRFLQLHTRGDDVACRYGGDEFVLILLNVPLSVAARRAEELPATLMASRRSTDFPCHSMPTISIGISAAPEHGFLAQNLLRIADAALYRAKTEGRNRVVVGEALTRGEEST